MTEKISILLLIDLIMTVVAVYFGLTLRFGAFPHAYDFLGLGAARVLIFGGVLIFSSFLAELYDYEKNNLKKEVFVKVLTATLISFFALSTLYYLIPTVMIGRAVLAISLALFAAFQLLWHISHHIVMKFPRFARRVLILGTGPLANQMGCIISSMHHNYVLTGYVNCTNEAVIVPQNSIIGNGDGLMETAQREKAHKIVVSLSERRGTFPLKDVLSCKLGGIEVMDAPSFYEQMTGKLLIENITPSWFIFSDGFKITHSKMFVKRAVDVTLSLAGLLVCLPFIPLIALAVKLDSQGPVFLRQSRMGQREKNFMLYKFRTMRQDAEASTGAVWSQKDDPRVTRIGKFLRKSRLDEIPQLFNVLKGDMSIVGPRPERPEFIENLKEVVPFYSERHFVKPGITGWAQIKYPYGSSVEDSLEKLRYDLFYIKNLTFSLDLLIMLETSKVILFGKGGR